VDTGRQRENADVERLQIGPSANEAPGSVSSHRTAAPRATDCDNAHRFERSETAPGESKAHVSDVRPDCALPVIVDRPTGIVAMRILLQLTVGAILSFPVLVTAQDHPTPFVAASAGVPLESGNASPPYINPGLSGKAFVGGFSAGIDLTPVWRVAVETALGGTYTANQRGRRSGGYSDFIREHESTFISGVLRGQVSNRRLHVLGGVESVRSRTSESQSDWDSPASLPGLTVPVLVATSRRTYSWWSTGAVVGVDYTMIEGRHVGVTPTLRLHIARQDQPDDSIGLGLGGVVLRCGVAIELGGRYP